MSLIRPPCADKNRTLLQLCPRPESQKTPVLIGRDLFQEVGLLLKERFSGARIFVVTDTQVGGLYGDFLLQELKKEGFHAFCYTLETGEEAKSFAVVQALLSSMLEQKLGRQDLIIALGGGVVGDVTGFAASICKRGIPLLHIPTSLVAQIDSSIGGKTAINMAEGKNLVGSFYHPALILIDPSLLHTLPEREMRAGYAELVKYALIQKPDFFSWLEKRAPEEKKGTQLLQNPQERLQAILYACACKISVVAQDPEEKSVRALLNFGHSFGHALEACNGYHSARLRHGEAIAVGMVWAFEFSSLLGFCSPQSLLRVQRHFLRCGLPTSLAALDSPYPQAEALFHHMLQDKKVFQGQIRLILTKGIGKAFVADSVSGAQLKAFLQKKCCPGDCTQNTNPLV